MRIETVYIKGFRNYCDAIVNFNETNLIIGANDVGKTNLLYAIRLLLDKSLSELDLEPKSNDFHVSSAGEQVENIEITIKFTDVSEDAVISKLGGYVSDEGEIYIKYLASSLTMDYKILLSHEYNNFDEVPNRFYLKCLSLRYINSQRDLEKYIKIEKKHLLRLAQEVRSEDDTENDGVVFTELNKLLTEVNEKVKGISYVASATEELNEELRKLSYTHDRLTVQLDTGAIGIDQFIEKLELSANTNGKKLMLGGDGFNNQILLALWKAKSVREHDVDSEVVIYCIEEPEAHLFPHQQRKLAAYLIDKLPGQAIVTSHSPQIAVNFKPDSIIKLYYDDGKTLAASNGCSDCISSAWDGMGYRMSIIPAEAFFANVVFLVEGPSEVIFYTELAKALSIDLDYYNISILSVDGIQFEVYRKILTALNINWVVRTDNDASKVPHKNEWQYAGVNRALALCGRSKEPNSIIPIDSRALHSKWGTISPIINPKGVYISFFDLEGDLANDFSKHVLDYASKDNLDDAADYLRGKKAIRMRELIKEKKNFLTELKSKDIARPLMHVLKIARGES
ncbi:ATP-dependent endonuclease [Serratia marcescens]|uniref:ATP-dependent nuclease n=1 Tax=Serratia marcescens TaxID=615 RepID=UPI0009A52B78|nr:AAA family ATPase [Serratia marcescens]OPJ98279.1 ATP-dependent endonuclease [Serratia marcescens]